MSTRPQLAKLRSLVRSKLGSHQRQNEEQRVKYSSQKELSSVLMSLQPHYHYLRLPPGCIRILIIQPSPLLEAEITCVMREVSLKDNPLYEALSYTWGEPTVNEQIIVDGRRFCVRENLVKALRHLRQSDKPRTMWVDAICIDQRSEDVGSLDERSQQVALMDKVYQQATNVCVWLGDADELSDQAMLFVAQILDLNQFDDLVKSASNQSMVQWRALVALMSRPWFTRRWVVQEIAFASAATVHCGSKILRWPDFADAVNLIAANGILNSLWEAQTIPATYLVYASTNLCRKSGDNRLVEKLRSLDVLLSKLTSFHVTDPRDTIFALLALAKDVFSGGEYQIVVDYSKDIVEISADFLNFSRHRSGLLDMICVPWAPMEEGESYPSWICSLRAGPYSVDTVWRPDKITHRQNADGLVGSLYRKNYRASLDTPAKGGYILSRVLSATGYVVDEVSNLGETALDGDIPVDWMESAQKPPKRNSELRSELFEQFWRTLAGDRGPDGSSPPSWYGRACKYAWKQAKLGKIRTTELVESGKSSVVGQYMKRIQCVTWNKRFGITARRTFGIFPPKTKIGDSICVIFGCSVPVVLRPEGEKYLLIGECFVYGIMDGEAMGRGHEEQVFQIT